MMSSWRIVVHKDQPDIKRNSKDQIVRDQRTWEKAHYSQSEAIRGHTVEVQEEGALGSYNVCLVVTTNGL